MSLLLAPRKGQTTRPEHMSIETQRLKYAQNGPCFYYNSSFVDLIIFSLYLEQCLSVCPPESFPYETRRTSWGSG